MHKEFSDAWEGRKIWKRLKKKFSIDYKSVVLILPENDEEWNQTALFYLPDFMRRKSAKRAVILTVNDSSVRTAQRMQPQDAAVAHISSKETELLLQYYCFYKFFENIVFLYLNQPRDNYSGFILAKGEVTKDEMICLGFYHLREVPAHV